MRQVGLIEEIGTDGSVKDLGIVDANITEDYMWAESKGASTGGLAGGSKGEIKGCYFTGNIKGRIAVGGLIGASTGTVRRCYSEGVVSSGHSAGGLIAQSIGKTASDGIYSSYSRANVSGEEVVGGLLGAGWGDIKNCYATGDVLGEKGVGGLVGILGIDRRGYTREGNLKNSYSIGNVSGGGGGWIGGLIGCHEYGEVKDSFWDMQSSCVEESAGGTGKPTCDMVLKETFNEAGWNFDEVWAIKEEETYPYLKWQEEETYPYASNYSISHKLEVKIKGEGTVTLEYGEQSVQVENKWSTVVEEGTNITLKVDPDSESEFENWGCDDIEERSEKEAELTMDEDKGITVVFEGGQEKEVEPSWNLFFFICIVMIVIIALALKKSRPPEKEEDESEEKELEEPLPVLNTKE